MTIYRTAAGTDTFFHLVTDDFHVLQQVRLQPRPCQCLVREEGGSWRWVSQDEAGAILAAWERQVGRAVAGPAQRQAA